RLGIRASDLKRAFEGDMDDVQVWNRALTQTEILQQMDSELSGNETGLIAYYKFNEGQGETLLDASVNANNAIRGSTDGADSNNPSWITQ
ncbi:MAG: LamG domain-containing protein, partial [Pseudomonadales bacterium]|nr:LamG domain-containing protein [Pseudomonadales bacterium]